MVPSEISSKIPLGIVLPIPVITVEILSADLTKHSSGILVKIPQALSAGIHPIIFPVGIAWKTQKTY